MSELRARLDVPLSAAVVAEARKAVRHVLTAWGHQDGDWLGGAELIVSELVSNAVRHGGGCIELSVQSHDGQVTLWAADGSSIVPRRRGTDGAGGYGIGLIEAFGQGWGVEEFEGGKRVWVRLRPCAPPAPLNEQ